MDPGELHILSAWGESEPARGATDSAILACVERLMRRRVDTDRVVLLADEHGERRAAALGLCTPLVASHGLLRGQPVRDALARLLARYGRPTRLVCWDDAMLRRIRATVTSIWRSAVETVDGRNADSWATRLPRQDRRTLRARFDLPAAEHVVILASDPPDSISAHDFIRAAALVALVGRDVTAIVPRQAPEMERAKATLRATGIPLRLMTCEAPIWTVLPCADAVVTEVVEGFAPRFTPPHAQRWLATTCARLGIPVVWPDPDTLGDERLDRWVLRPRSRLAVHVARAINEHFLGCKGSVVEPDRDGHEVLS
jgi:hypothetical protein